MRWLACLVALTIGGRLWAGDSGVEFFEKQIRPVLSEMCYRCHSATAEKVRGGLRLDSRAGLLKGGDGGPGVVPNQPGKSRLIAALKIENLQPRGAERGRSRLKDALLIWAAMH